jgi:hypothetical protein
VRNVVELAGPQLHPQQSVGRPSALAARTGHLEESSCQHWPTIGDRRMDCILLCSHKRH